MVSESKQKKINRKKKKAQYDTNVMTTVKNRTRRSKERNRFIRTRMWLSTLISHFFPDRGTIPQNIGNNILITNNLYITKNHLTAIILVTEMSEETPLNWTSDLLGYVKDIVPGVIVDITMKGQKYHPDITPSAINSRERTWRETLDNEYMPVSYVRRAARCLYTLDVVRSGIHLYKERIYLQVRAQDGTQLKRGLQAVEIYLSQIEAKYKRITSGIQEHMQYMLLMSDKKPEHMKDIPSVIFSSQTVAESVPITQGWNDVHGVLMGYDIVSGFPYYIDFKKTSAAKNIMIEAYSGWGKSFMASYWLYPFFACGFNLSIMDIKGNEFSALTKALGGKTLSMRPSSTYYINTYCWRVDELKGEDPRTYANKRFVMSKERMLCICDLPEKLSSQAESLLEEFLQNVYKTYGVSSDNVNTWSRTSVLNPYLIFDLFEKYVSHEIKIKYKDVWEKMLERLRIYMSRRGSKSHMYRDAYSYLEVLDTKCLTFDFGILENSNNTDNVMFRLHIMDMLTINDEYVSYKKKNHEWTVRLLEESQAVDDWLMKVYTREITLRRAQNQVTVLLGNSVAALARNPLSAPIIENINILCLGSLNLSSRKFLHEEFGLNDVEANLLEEIQQNPDLTRKFLLINRMERDSTIAILEANVADEVANSELFKIVDTEE